MWVPVENYLPAVFSLHPSCRHFQLPPGTFEDSTGALMSLIIFLFLPSLILILGFIYLFILEIHCSNTLGLFLISLFPFWCGALIHILIPFLHEVLPLHLSLYCLCLTVSMKPWQLWSRSSVSGWPAVTANACSDCVIPKPESSVLFTVLVLNTVFCNQLHTYINNKQYTY